MRKQRKNHVITRFLALLSAFLLLVCCLSVPANAEEDTVYLFGTASLCSSYGKSVVLKDSFYFSDSWFFNDPAVRNDELALVSLQLASASHRGAENNYGTAFLKDLGFEEVTLSTMDVDEQDPCSYNIGKKKITDGTETYDLVAVVVQSYGYDTERYSRGWMGNFRVNGESEEDCSGEHYGIKVAADKVVDQILEYGGDTDVRYWIAGHSRGGAVANILSVRLKDRLIDSGNHIFTYTFESPATVDNDLLVNNESENAFIHNYLTRDDLVTKLPFWEMGRYGVTYEIKTDETDANLAAELEKLGSRAGEVKQTGDEEEIEEMLIETLRQAIPTRKAYSEERTETFKDPEGVEHTFRYSYQETLMKLVGILMRGELSDMNLSELNVVNTWVLAAYNSLIDAAYADAEGQDSRAFYWVAAEGVLSFLKKAKPGISLTQEDLYLILRLAGPQLIDTSRDKEEAKGDINATITAVRGMLSKDEEIPSENVSAIQPLLDLYKLAPALVFSHFYDTGVARMKTLAPQPVIQKEQPMKVSQKVKKLTVKKSAVKKKAQSFALSKYAKITKNKGKVTYRKVSGSAKIKVNSSSGKITVKKGTGKGTYKIKIKITAAGTATYKAGSKTITLAIVVK